MEMTMIVNDGTITRIMDIGAVSVAGMTWFLQILPDAAALLSVVWLVLRVYETETVQRAIYWLRTRGKEDTFED